MVVAIVALAGAATYLGCRMRRTPSVVLVTIDTLRADRLGAYGRSPTITPRLDALAAKGTVFENAWTTAPLTVPAHASLLTGLVPPGHGLRLNHPNAKLADPNRRRFSTLAEVFGENGYDTGAFVSASVLRADATGLDAGFDRYDEVPAAKRGALHDAERPAAETVGAALDWVRGASRPAFLWVHLFDPHAPYDAPEGFGAGDEHAADATGYDGEVAYVDHWIGRLLDGLDAAGLGDAIVVVVADHGEGLGEHGEASHGFLLHEATLRVPLIVAGPGVEAGRRAEPVSMVDVFPTLLALTSQAIPPQVHGVPILPRASKLLTERAIYAETLYGWDACRWAQTFAFRRGEEKLVASGPLWMALGLGTDPAEERPSEPSIAQREALRAAIDAARRMSPGAMAPGGQAPVSGSYWSSGSTVATPMLRDDENALLRSPYDSMGLLARLHAAQAALAAGRAESALAAFDALHTEDDKNPQTQFWRGRALHVLRRPVEAARAFRDAFDLGAQSPECVQLALKESLLAVAPQDGSPPVPSEWQEAIAFLGRARKQGFREDAFTYAFEAVFYLQEGHEDAARAESALSLAERAPGAEAARESIAQVRELLEAHARKR